MLRVAVLALLASRLAAQTKGATIAGSVRDSLAQPVAGADVVVQPGSERTRSDSAGNFMLTGLGGGTYVVAARKVGYAPDRWDVTLARNGRTEIKFVLARRTQLDTVRVTADRECATRHLDGFECRRSRDAAMGLFWDYMDIDERGTTRTTDLFRHMPGFRVELRRARGGAPTLTPVRTNGGCIVSIVDGLPASGANPVPAYPSDISAMEIYARPDSVPKEFVRYSWGGVSTRSPGPGRCAIVVYWTIWASYKQ
jgi:hypothetical protein